MEGITVYKHAKSARPKHYPALVRKDLVGIEHAPDGSCQSRGCEERAEYLRTWLCPDTPGKLTVPYLNGVRYCAAHAQEVADATGMPMLRLSADLAEYHDQIVDIEQSATTSPLPERLLHASVIIVAKLGTLRRRKDGTYQVTLNDGSVMVPCCRHVALRLVGFDLDKSLPPHSSPCRAR